MFVNGTNEKNEVKVGDKCINDSGMLLKFNEAQWRSGQHVRLSR